LIKENHRRSKIPFRFIFFFAGADTSSTSIAFAMLELGANSEIQEKLRKEIREKSGEKITYENLQEMTYLNQVASGECHVFKEFVHLIVPSNLPQKFSDSTRQLSSSFARPCKTTKFLEQNTSLKRTLRS
jgi:hypothetical protein